MGRANGGTNEKTKEKKKTCAEKGKLAGRPVHKFRLNLPPLGLGGRDAPGKKI